MRFWYNVSERACNGGVRELGANRSTNYNMLSLSCEFLKPLRGR
jgi:hypothetical protein